MARRLSAPLARVGWALDHARRVAVRATSRALLRDDRGAEVPTVLVVGTARSGTTWVGDLLAADRPTRVLFEPFHPRRAPESRPFGLFPYRRADARDAAFEAYLARVFEGRVRGKWIDRELSCRRPTLRVVKAVRLSLCLGFLRARFPDVPIVVVHRHPCAVVLSRIRAGWSPDEDLAAMEAQRALVDDLELEPLLRGWRERSEAERNALVWAIHTLGARRAIDALAAARSEGVVEVRYEDLWAEPARALARVYASTGLGDPSVAIGRVRRPSSTAAPGSAVVSGADPTATWRRKLPEEDARRVFETVRLAGLGRMYDEARGG